MPLHLLYVKNLTAQRKNSLMEAVASLLGRTTSRVTLDKENLALLRILDRAVGQLAWQTSTCHKVLALYTLACLACCNTCCSGQDHFFTNLLCLVWMFL